jgi:hypothetical protein
MILLLSALPDEGNLPKQILLHSLKQLTSNLVRKVTTFKLRVPSGFASYVSQTILDKVKCTGYK